MTLGHRPNGIHFGTLAKKMHHHNCLGFRRDLAFNLVRINIEGNRIDITKNRGGPRPDYRAHCGKKGVGWQNHLVPWANFQSQQSQGKGICPRATPQGKVCLAILCQFFFQSGHFRPENHLARIQHPFQGRIELGAQFPGSDLHIAQWNRCFFYHDSTPRRARMTLSRAENTPAPLRGQGRLFLPEVCYGWGCAGSLVWALFSVHKHTPGPGRSGPEFAGGDSWSSYQLTRSSASSLSGP